MSRFDADAFLDSIRAARRRSKSSNSNTFEVGEFLHSIELAQHIEALEAARLLRFDASGTNLPIGVDSAPSDIE